VDGLRVVWLPLSIEKECSVFSFVYIDRVVSLFFHQPSNKSFNTVPDRHGEHLDTEQSAVAEEPGKNLAETIRGTMANPLLAGTDRRALLRPFRGPLEDRSCLCHF
jgi:hypothetical protein